jgi:formate-dependent nitrite reductase cytochrome c552 subunit
MKFKHVFIAVFVTAGIVGAALLVAHERPPAETDQPSADMVKATGKCAECHSKETSAVVHQFERSTHARSDVTCLDCHAPAENQESMSHRGFEISEDLTSANCAKCHAEQHKQYMRSRHAAPAWAAVKGAEDFTEEQIEHAEKYHEGTVKRPANKLAQLEGPGAIEKGCGSCHAIGKPNPDGSIGSCTECHSRHNTSLALARSPETCGQCHMGPDHSQLEIFKESKHGVLFNLQRDSMNLDADPKTLTTEDMPVPTCSTCHMSGLEGMKVTHDVGERLGWYLFADVSEKRPNFQAATDEMQAVCAKCHTEGHTEKFYAEAETVLHTTNEKVTRVSKVMDGLYEDGLLTKEKFDEPIEFVYFDFWHYYGRTAKHGAYMGGADYVQWHGNYELLLHEVEIEEMAEEIREKKGHAENGHDKHETTGAPVEDSAEEGGSDE